MKRPDSPPSFPVKGHESAHDEDNEEEPHGVVEHR